MLWRGRPDIGDERFVSDPKRLRTLRYRFDVSQRRGHGWREDPGGEFLSTSQLADSCIDQLVQRIRMERLGNR